MHPGERCGKFSQFLGNHDALDGLVQRDTLFFLCSPRLTVKLLQAGRQCAKASPFIGPESNFGERCGRESIDVHR